MNQFNTYDQLGAGGFGSVRKGTDGFAYKLIREDESLYFSTFHTLINYELKATCFLKGDQDYVQIQDCYIPYQLGLYEVLLKFNMYEGNLKEYLTSFMERMEKENGMKELELSWSDFPDIKETEKKEFDFSDFADLNKDEESQVTLSDFKDVSSKIDSSIISELPKVKAPQNIPMEYLSEEASK